MRFEIIETAAIRQPWAAWCTSCAQASKRTAATLALDGVRQRPLLVHALKDAPVDYFENRRPVRRERQPHRDRVDRSMNSEAISWVGKTMGIQTIATSGSELRWRVLAELAPLGLATALGFHIADHLLMRISLSAKAAGKVLEFLRTAAMACKRACHNQ